MNEQSKYSLSSVDRTRWNVVDLVSIVGRKAVRGYIFNDVDMSWAEKLRKELRQRGQRVTVTAILLKAIAIAQRTHPITRQGYLPFGRRAQFHNIVAGITVERCIGSKASVYFAVIDDPDKKPIEQIAAELKMYKEAPLDSVDELRKETFYAKLPWWFRRIALWFGMTFPAARLLVNRATFGVSSLGTFGASAAFGPCVCTATIGVGSVEERLVVKDGKVEARPIMTISLSFDHRVLDGVPAAQFMQDIQKLLEGGLEQYLTVANLEAVASQ